MVKVFTLRRLFVDLVRLSVAVVFLGSVTSITIFNTAAFSCWLLHTGLISIVDIHDCAWLYA